jgi:hypothetical protein
LSATKPPDNATAARRFGEDQHLLWDVVDADASGPGGADYSCDPNLWMLHECTGCARRDIAAGEELTIDYALATVSPERRIELWAGHTPS